MPTKTVTKESRSGREYELEVTYEEGRLLRSGDRESPAEYAEDEILSVHYLGEDVTDFICGIYSVNDLLN